MEGEGELGRRPPSEFGMRARAVVVGPPISKGNASLGQRREQRLVQEFVPQSPIEALDEGIEGILHGFVRCDVVPFDAAVISPGQDGVAGEFAAIVADHHLRLHYHAIIDRPYYCSFDEFRAVVTDQWLRTDFGYRQIDVQDAATPGWTNYILKSRQKISLLDSIDWNNCHLIAE